MVLSMKIILSCLKQQLYKVIYLRNEGLVFFTTIVIIIFIFIILKFLGLFLFLLFQVLPWSLKIAIRRNVNRKVKITAIIVICSGIAAVVIIVVVCNAWGEGVSRRAILK